MSSSTALGDAMRGAIGSLRGPLVAGGGKGVSSIESSTTANGRDETP
jgi:hypothetical protein